MFVRKVRINKKYINKIKKMLKIKNMCLVRENRDLQSLHSNHFESFLKNQFRMCFFKIYLHK